MEWLGVEFNEVWHADDPVLGMDVSEQPRDVNEEREGQRGDTYVGVRASRDGDVRNGDICFQPMFDNRLGFIVFGILQLFYVPPL